MAKSFKITLKRGLIGTTQLQRDVVRCLGLRRINDTRTIKDNPANRGQIYKVQHLLDVQVEK
ncbi:MAG TPA: 50S ribosomal protein L30 [Bdellovibrionales bacterium]|nr:50S ribosomal protein L30 [Bdellovibrionales bacterium]